MEKVIHNLQGYSSISALLDSRKIHVQGIYLALQTPPKSVVIQLMQEVLVESPMGQSAMTNASLVG